MKKLSYLFSVLFFVIASTTGAGAQSIDLNGPAGSGSFGFTVTVLTNGNYVVADPAYDNGAIVDVGAVYLYNGNTHALISTLTGSTANDQVGSNGVTALSNGNYVVRSGTWDNGPATDAGAVTWGNGITGVSGVVSSSNSLVGNRTNDLLGSGGVSALSNGNYVVLSPDWDNGAASNAGAITWGNGTTGVSGVVSSSNSLVGSRTSDGIGNLGITMLSNGNFVAASLNWDNGAITDAGAVTWCNGSSGTSGVISSSNSLVGSTAGDQIGNVVVALSNGNYVVRSTNWDNGAATDAGAVTWGNGTSGTSGFISSSNSLVGSTASDQVGNGIQPLSNGNYVVTSFIWDNGAAADAGAVTWGNGTSGTSGVISSSNSLVGSMASDNLGGGGITTLSNGNYVVSSPFWDNGAITDAGSVTWCNGATGTTGVVNSSNSLVGSKASDQVGSIGIIALSNSNYLVHSPFFDNGVIANAGAVTWGNGTSGTTGAVSSSNSLVGSTANDNVGLINVAPLSNGNYVVIAPNWDNGATANAGAVTWCNGSTGRTGTLTSGNSLVGSTVNDQVGSSGVTALSNGNYVVKSSNWDNGAIANVGAATWGNGTSGITGVVSSSNSLVGSTTGDAVGIGGVVALSNGNYVVSSTSWDNGAVANVGAATWGNGTTGTTGVVSSSNSLVGSTASDGVGSAFALSNGNYLARSLNWDNGAATNAGAITWGNGTTGITGVISSSNSLVGGTANDQIGNNITFLSNGNYVVRSTLWDNGAATNAGAATWGNGTTGITGVISSSNSLVGSTAGDGVGIITALSNGNYLVRSNNWDNGAITDAGAITWGNGSTGVKGTISTCNSVIGTSASGGANMNFAYNTVYPNLLVGRQSDNIVTVFNPASMALANSLDAVTVNISGTNEVPLIASGACRIIASLTPNGGASAITGTVNAKVWIESSVPVFNVLPFVARHFDITPVSNAATATGRVILYFTQQEFDDFNADPASFWDLPANAGDAAGKANLRVARYSGTSSNGSGLPGTYTPGAQVIDPVDTDITWNSTLSRWEVSFDMTGFGGFVVQTTVYALPVSMNFNGQLQNNNALLNWQTANENNIRAFILERSTDGQNYAAVYDVAAFNTAGNHPYHFTDRGIDALKAAVVYYRIKQVDMDGRVTYSNIVALSPAGKNMLLLYPNPVQDKASLLITVNKPQLLYYRILDNTGKTIMVQQRTVVNGSNVIPVDVSVLPKGLYWIELRGESFVERKPFIKN